MNRAVSNAFALLLSGALAACAAQARAPGTVSSLPQLVRLPSPTGNPIRHVVIIVQENRSFDNIFSGFPGADAPAYGISFGKRVPLKPSGFGTPDLCHGFSDGLNDWNRGKMDGFAENCAQESGTSPLLPYSYLRRDLVQPYWSMAAQYTLADRMFPTMFGPSYTAHLDMIAGTTDLNPTHAVADLPTSTPWGCDAPAGTQTSVIDTSRQERLDGPFPCFTQFRTMADTLDAAHVSWRYYAPPIAGDGSLWSAFDSIKSVRYGGDWSRNVVSPSPKVLADVAAGNLAAVTWVIPDWAYADHATTGNLGPSWVASVVNAVGESKDWDSTAIFVLWDDWGGWYDDAPPPQLDFRGLGIRVGCIVISPYARKHYVSHTTYEFASILRFVEERFGLPQLGTLAQGYTDARAASIADSFDFTRPPSAFTPIEAPYPPSKFLRMKPSYKLPDDI